MPQLIGDLTGSSADNFGNTDLVVSKYVATATGLASTVSIAIQSSSFTSIQLAIYADSSGNPGALLGNTGTITDTTAGTKTASLVSGVNLNSGTAYWLGCLVLGGTMNVLTKAGEYRGRTGQSSLMNPYSGPDDFSFPFQVPMSADSAASAPGPFYVASGAAATAASGNVTPSYPAGIQADDILLCEITSEDNVTATFGGSGWTKKSEVNNGSLLRQTIAWKRRASGDSDTNVAITHTAGGRIVARIHAIRNCKKNGDPFEADASSTPTAASTGSFPNLTTAVPNDLMVYALSYGNDFTTGPSISNAQGLTLTEQDETEVT